jgi:hypothetical protein
MNPKYTFDLSNPGFQAAIDRWGIPITGAPGENDIINLAQLSAASTQNVKTTLRTTQEYGNAYKKECEREFEAILHDLLELSHAELKDEIASIRLSTQNQETYDTQKENLKYWLQYLDLNINNIPDEVFNLYNGRYVAKPFVRGEFYIRLNGALEQNAMPGIIGMERYSPEHNELRKTIIKKLQMSIILANTNFNCDISKLIKYKQTYGLGRRKKTYKKGKKPKKQSKIHRKHRKYIRK